jgi:hypothetical protein
MSVQVILPSLPVTSNPNGSTPSFPNAAAAADAGSSSSSSSLSKLLRLGFPGRDDIAAVLGYSGGHVLVCEGAYEVADAWSCL